MDKWMNLQYRLATPEERAKNGWKRQRESEWKGTHRAGWKNKAPSDKPYWNPDQLSDTGKRKMGVALDKLINDLKGKRRIVWHDGICYDLGVPSAGAKHH